jgi:hypothetical protein
MTEPLARSHPAGEARRPFVAPTVEDLGALTIVTQQTFGGPGG